MILVLVDVERWLELPPSMAAHHRTSMHRHTEAALAIHEPDYPVWIEHIARTCSFLLIVRTGRIFTAHVDIPDCGCDADEYRRILGCSSKQWGFPTAKLELHRYSSRVSPCRHGAWTISSSLCFKEGALRMVSEDSQFLKACRRHLLGITEPLSKGPDSASEADAGAPNCVSRVVWKDSKVVSTTRS